MMEMYNWPEMPDEIWAGTYFDQETQNEWREQKMTGSEKYHHSRVVEALQKENAELKAKLAKTEWRPIETAPNGKVRLWWKDEDWKGYMSDEIDQRGNRVWYVYTGKNCIMAADPTHWMPLPEPPTTE